MTNNNDRNSIFLRNIERGKQEGLISFTDENARITYHCSRNYSTSFKTPYLIVACKKDGVTDAEFKQALDCYKGLN